MTQTIGNLAVAILGIAAMAAALTFRYYRFHLRQSRQSTSGRERCTVPYFAKRTRQARAAFWAYGLASLVVQTMPEAGAILALIGIATGYAPRWVRIAWREMVNDLRTMRFRKMPLP